MNLSPEQLSSLKHVATDPAAKAAAAIQRPIPEVRAVIDALLNLVKTHARAFRHQQLMLRFKPGSSAGRKIDVSAVRGFLQAGTPIIDLGDGCTVLSTHAGAVTAPFACDESSSCMVFVCSAGTLVIYSAGRPIAEIGERPPDVEGKSDWISSWTELPRGFHLHFEHIVSRQQNIRYWQNRDKRILLAVPDGTERIFQHSLVFWCRHYLDGVLDAYPEPTMRGIDKTDLTLVTTEGNTVVEIKWLGSNGSSSYDQKRIKEGVIQVGEYLTNEPSLHQGYLVIYDGRALEEHKNKSDYPASHRHAKCADPVIFFLPSETPSQAASRIAAQD